MTRDLPLRHWLPVLGALTLAGATLGIAYRGGRMAVAWVLQKPDVPVTLWANQTHEGEL